MKFSVSLLLPVLFAAPAVAQSDQTPPAEAPSNASKAAEDFSLDLNADDAATVPEATESAPVPQTAPVTAATSAASRFTVDTPIEQLLADSRSKAVVDRNLPGLSTDKNLDKIRNLSLRALQSHSGGKLTDALLEKTGTELAAIPARRPASGR